MVSNLIVLVVMAVVAVLFGWLAKRSWGARRAAVKWPGTILSTLIGLLIAAVTVLGAIGFSRVYSLRHDPIPDLKVAGTADQVARGEHLASIICTSCHTTNNQLPLSGGRDIEAEIGAPIGMIVPPNLTPGGPLKNWSDGDIWRAIRAGEDAQGHTLAIMNAIGDPRFLSDDDLQALIAYLRSQPAVSNQTPAESFTPLALVMTGAGLFQQLPPTTGTVTAPPQGPTAAYGVYVVHFAGCRSCHGNNLAGNTGFGPHGPNLTLIVPQWTQAQFSQYIRGGTNPVMALYTRMDDTEIAALYQYLHGLAPIQK